MYDAPPSAEPDAVRAGGDRFTGRFTHRLRFTTDVLGADAGVLLDLLEPSGDRPAKVQVWADEFVLAANPRLVAAVGAVLGSAPDRVVAAGVYPIAGGEAVKNDWAHVERVLDAVNAHDLDRRSYVLVVGGGAVLDAVGFAAATAHRGVRLVRLPTTTLAQADSGVGVKNAVNRYGKKNWLGTFASPWGVVNDARLLDTLPDRDFVAGFSEAVKVTLLKTRAGFERLERDAGRIRRRDPAAYLPAIRESAEVHRRHIMRGGDPFEALEARPLDYGHWSAHRLEAVTNFRVRHGEAVGVGVAVDTVYSSLVHGLPAADAARVLHTLRAFGLPLMHEQMLDFDALFAGLEEFRQHLGGRLTLTMLRGIGDPLEVHEVDHAAMRRAIEQVAAVAAGKPCGAACCGCGA